MKLQRITLLTVLFLMLSCAGLFAQTKKNTQTSAKQDTVLIVIDGRKITTEDLRNKINTVPAMNRHHYKSINGQKKILDYLVQREIFYSEALKLGYDKDEEVKKIIHQRLKPIINQIYFDEVLAKDLKLSEQDLQNYYATNRSAYTIAPRVTIQYLQTNSENLNTVQEQINNRIDFEKIIAEHSLNEFSVDNKGIIRNIRLNGFISGIGRDPELDKLIADATIDHQIIHGPFTTSTGIHFFKKLDYEPTVIRPFAEVKTEIENRLKAQKQNEIYVDLMDKLRMQYNVRFHKAILDSLNVLNIMPNQRNIIIAEGSHPEITITFSEVGQLLRNAASMERMNINDPAVRENIIKREIDSRLLYAHAQNQKIHEKHSNKFEIKDLKIDIIVNHWYSQKIASQIKVSQEEIDKHYIENTDKYTTPASRNIRQFVSQDEKAARKHRRKINGFLKKNQEDRIITYLRNESIKPDGDGLLKHVYQNDIIPGVGKDETYNAKVWDLKIKELSDIFKNRHGDVIFFYVVEETPPSVTPLESIEASIRNIISRRKAQEKFEEIKDDLIVKYNAYPHYELLVSSVTAQQLFDMAEEAQKKFSFAEAIFFFDQIIDDYADTDDAYKAFFMKAFITAEELKDTAKGIALFEEFLDKYKDGDLNEDAKFMLKTLQTGTSIESFLKD